MNPFTNRDRTHGLYQDPERLQRRTGTLHRAKVAGPAVPDTIAALDAQGRHDVVLDVGCGRGTTTATLARAWAPRAPIGVDHSAPLLRDARTRVQQRAPEHAARVRYLRADFRALPCPTGTVDVTIAAFCLYHAPDPAEVVGELRRCLHRGGRAILVTKSADSYRELDALLTSTGLDADAARRPSLYEAFHGDNAAQLVERHLRVTEVLHHEHRFHFTETRDLASYLITSPRYELPSSDPGTLGAALAGHLGTGVTASSTVTYVVARTP